MWCRSSTDGDELGLLVALSTYVRQRGGRLRLLRASRRVRTMVQVTGLSAVLGMAAEPAGSSAAWALTPLAATADNCVKKGRACDPSECVRATGQD